MLQFQSRPSAKYYQALIGNEAKWLVTDASGVIAANGIVHNPDGTISLTTVANAGTVYFTRPIAPIDASAEQGSLWVNVRADTATPGDQVAAGLCDNADPTAGGALSETYGVHVYGANRGVTTGKDLTISVGPSSAFDRTIANILYHGGLSAQQGEAWGYLSSTKVTVKTVALTTRVITPTHFMVSVKQAAAAAQTMVIAVGTHVPPSLPSYDIEPRA